MTGTNGVGNTILQMVGTESNGKVFNFYMK